jgi:hypothetical protein
MVRPPNERSCIGIFGLVAMNSTFTSVRFSGITVTRATASLTSTEAALAALAAPSAVAAARTIRVMRISDSSS